MDMQTASPFHTGEQAIQERLGVREKMERFGRQVIRDHMPDQHREFYSQLPFVLAGHADRDGWPWASMLVNPPGFISSPDPQTLKVAGRPLEGDPLADGLSAGSRLGLLGIEFHSRRRNRLSAHVTGVSAEGFSLAVDQAFGNCPQYIQTRAFRFESQADRDRAAYEPLSSFDQRALRMIDSADTFFVASYVAGQNDAASEGVDVSHRGGRPGFVRIDDDRTLTVPDYLGNFHFNTLGNFLVNPKAGLLFVDFNTGDVLTLTGHVEILWDDPDTKHFAGAERLWRFTLDHGRFLPAALPLRWSFGEYSPNTLLTGTWADAEALQAADAERDTWRNYQVVRIEDESSVIRSFYLEPEAGALPGFQPGQFLTLQIPVNGDKLLRTYTVSSAPADSLYRISVKREASGAASRYLHEQITVGDTLQAKAPTGNFTFDAAQTRPAVLLSAGVGITPMVSMLRHAVHEGIRTRDMRRIVFIHSAADVEQRAFYDEARRFAGQADGRIEVYSTLSRVSDNALAGKDFQLNGRIDRNFLQSVLCLDDYDYYLCGPEGFMQSMYDLLRDLGASDARIFAEAFGPASLQRLPDSGTQAFSPGEEAPEALVEFADSGFEQLWTPETGSLLEFAEAHGLTPAYGCRSGQCGSCKTRLLAGKVAYRQAPEASLDAGDILLCCAVPAAAEDQESVRLRLSL